MNQEELVKMEEWTDEEQNMLLAELTTARYDSTISEETQCINLDFDEGNEEFPAGKTSSMYCAPHPSLHSPQGIHSSSIKWLFYISSH